jgi:hypothetical protein
VSKRNRTNPSRPRAARTTPSAATSAPQRGRLIAATVAAAAITAGGVVYLGQTGADDDAVRVGANGALPPAEFPEPGVEHVHGLGVDPADGTLYAATHFGLFRLPESGGEATRVANRYQDTMGFTVVGANTFLGSGHPDFREDSPPRLGLIESTDAGQTWQPLSLSGEADFHALHAAHGNVYGYEAGSGQFMVSADREQWETRSELPMRDFAVSPTDPDTLLATTERGLVRSTDGGRGWSSVDGAPTLAVLAWGTADALYGVSPSGTVHVSDDGGTTWSARDDVGGPPEAVTVDDGDGEPVLYVAVADRGILQSDDGGRTFTTRYAE